MTKVIIDDGTLSATASAIRGKNGTEVQYKPSEFAQAITDLSVDEPVNLGPVYLTANGTYDPEDMALDGFDEVEVDVPNTYQASDEGKVVSSGALVAQGSLEITENGIYNTALYNEVTVNISGGGSGGGSYVMPLDYSWETGSDEDILSVLNAYYDGLIELEDIGWEVGAERDIQVAAMAATGVSESHAAQTITMVIMNVGGYELTPTQRVALNNTDRTHAAYIIGPKHLLASYGYMNSTNTNSGGWRDCARRTWCNDVFYNALDEAFQGLIKQVKVIASQGSLGHSDTYTTNDYFFLPAEKEVFGSNIYGNSTAESSLSQWTWFETSSHRIKAKRSGSASGWWERSPCSGVSSYFCNVGGDGSASANSAYGAGGLAPSGCI